MTLPINHPAIRFLAAPVVGAVILGGAALGLASVASAESGTSTSTSASSGRGPGGSGGTKPSASSPTTLPKTTAAWGGETAPWVPSPSAPPRPKSVAPASATDPAGRTESSQEGPKLPNANPANPKPPTPSMPKQPGGLTPVEEPAPVVHTPVEVPAGSAKLGPGGGGLTPVKPASPSAQG